MREDTELSWNPGEVLDVISDVVSSLIDDSLLLEDWLEQFRDELRLVVLNLYLQVTCTEPQLMKSEGLNLNLVGDDQENNESECERVNDASKSVSASMCNKILQNHDFHAVCFKEKENVSEDHFKESLRIQCD